MSDDRRPQDDAARQRALERYAVLDTPPEPAFDEVAELASRICETPVGLVSLVDRGRQWHKAEHGLGVHELPIEASICVHAVAHHEVFVIEDLRTDPRFRDTWLVAGPPRMRFYAGAPIVTPQAVAIGTVCVMDREPRRLASEKLEVLRALARQVMGQLELRRATMRSENFLRETINALSEHIAIIDARGIIAYVNRAWDDFARRYAAPVLLDGLGAGADYLEVCTRSAARVPEAAAVGVAIRDALAGEAHGFTTEYPCHSPREQRWFAVRVTAFSVESTRYAVVSHQNITGRKRAEREVRALNQTLEARVRSRTAELERAEAEVRSLTRRVLQAEEHERRALARELHDRVGQNLSALNLNLQLVREQLSQETGALVDRRIEDAQQLLRDTTRQVRDVMVELRPPGLDEYGLVTALRNYAERMGARYPAQLRVSGVEPDPRLAPEVETALFRIAQEALTNAAKHAGAQSVEVRLESDAERVRLSIADDGVGFDPDQRRGASFGLATMRERAAAVDARLVVDAAPGSGTRLTVEVAHR